MCALRLEVFEDLSVPSARATGSAELGVEEDAKLASYEQGYSAGWEDAAAAQSEDQSRLRADIARNLQSLGFTFQEARAHVLRAVEPLLTEMVQKLLPDTARVALGPLILQTLAPFAAGLAETPVSLVLNPASRTAVETFLARTSGLPLVIVEEPSLSEGQVYLRLGETEARIDLDAETAAITQALQGFYALMTEERKYG